MKLYKYVSPDRIDILQKQRIRFSQQYAQNDPFESQPYYTDHFENGLVQNNWNASTGQFESKPGKDLLTAFINNNFVSLSLTTKKDNLLMWAHYAANHSGFVIELDSEHPFFSDSARYLYKVPYGAKRSEVKLQECETLVAEIAGRLKKGSAQIPARINALTRLFKKSKDWAYEDEWRLLTTPELSLNYKPADHILTLNGGSLGRGGDLFTSDFLALYQLPASCITGIYCGARIGGAAKRQLFLLIRNSPAYLHVKLRQVEIDHAEYKLNFRDFCEGEVLTGGEFLYEADVRNGKRKRLKPKWYQLSYIASYEREKRALSVKV